MNTIKKFTTFDELKSCENKDIEYTSSLLKHNDFEKVIREIRLSKITKVNRKKTKS